MTDYTSTLGTIGDVKTPPGLGVNTADEKQMFKAALEFERFFLQHLMQGMDAATKALKGDESGEESAGGSTAAYTDMARDQLTQAMLDGGGIGLASMIYKQITGQQGIDGVHPPASGNKGGGA